MTTAEPSDRPSLLAPGFRFHPTDEELVSYYLRRKVLGRPLRVDAIAEVDLYRTEPWDLPPLSRIQTRDLEWYFFSSLDRKYASRSRTNRATAQGYWKTTGKDRPVRHGGRVAGMKKTLVFHVGRAPKGERTNWVMHEYRLEGENMDGYVVCRIFRKSGAGPQNGAQYGAPFVEQEWDEEEEEEASGLVMLPAGVGNEVNVAKDDEFEEFDRFVQEMGNQDQGSQAQLAETNMEDCSNSQFEEQPEDQTFLADIVDSTNEFVPENNSPRLTEETENKLGTPSSRSDEYLELNDLMNIPNGESPSENSDNYPLRASFTRRWVNGEGSSSHILSGDDDFNCVKDENQDQSELFQMLPVEDNLFPQPHDLPNTYACPPWNDAEDDMGFYDVPNEFSFMPESLFQLNEQDSSIPGPSSLDTIDDFMTYFDATDHLLNYDTISQVESTGYAPSHSDNASMVDGSLIKKEVVSSANVDGASSSVLPEQDDVPSNETTEKPSRKHLINMLGSLSAPSAFASESPAKAGKVMAHVSAASSSVHVTAGFVELHGLAMADNGANWFLQKNSNIGFLLSCSVVDTLVSTSVYPEPITKVYGGTISVVLTGGFNLIVVSALILAVSCKAAMFIYSR